VLKIEMLTFSIPLSLVSLHAEATFYTPLFLFKGLSHKNFGLLGGKKRGYEKQEK